MALLYTIFPGLEGKDSKSELPNWHGKDKPWEIIDLNSEKSIINQLAKMEFVSKNSNIKFNDVDLDEESGRIYIHHTAKIGKYVRIEGPSYIGKNVEIRHSAYLRKGSWICENALVGHCSEIKNSILLPGAKAPHFNYVGDSILGFDVNIGAGVKLSNVRNDRQSIIVELKNGDRFDTGLKKFGALIGDSTEIGCNVVSNPGTIIEPYVMINPNSTLSRWNSNYE